MSAIAPTPFSPNDNAPAADGKGRLKGTIAHTPFDGGASAFEAKVAPVPHRDKTAGSNSGSAANVFESRVQIQQ